MRVPPFALSALIVHRHQLQRQLGAADELRDLRSEDRANKDAIRVLNKNQRASLQKFGVVRYNAFKEMGGKLSFCVALLNDQNDGFIINSVHSSDGCYTYAKEIIAARSGVALGEEEQEALNKALGFVGSSRQEEPEDEIPLEEERSLPPVRPARIRKTQIPEETEEEEYFIPAKRLLRKNEEEPRRPTAKARILRQKVSEGLETEKSRKPGVRNTESLPDTSAITRLLSETSRKEMSLADEIKQDLLSDSEEEPLMFEEDEDIDMASLGFEEIG